MGSDCAYGDEEAQQNLTAAQLEFFEKQVRPLLVKHCYECHSADAETLQAGLLVDSRQGLLQGGDSGPAVVVNDADTSLLVAAVRYEALEMPPQGKLPDKDIKTLERWVNMGAPWPDEAAPKSVAAGEKFDLQKRRAEHWCWQPVRSPDVPVVTDNSWPRTNLDHFILARLEAAGLTPAGNADRHALARRLYFDLIGLPPTPEQVRQFVTDKQPGAIERLVDQLLDSPRFGERWGRHWLDLVRYAESRGHEFDNDAHKAYQYRDYVIRAFNADVPYDQLVREHIAGDLLDPPRQHPQEGFNESVLGTGFWFLGEWAHSPVDIRKDEADRFDNMIDVMSKTFLGVTVSCARCHDHKFDAISTADYYALSGFLQSSDYRQVRFESLEHNRQIARELGRLDESFREQLDEQLAALPSLAKSIEAELAQPLVEDCIVLDYAHLDPGDFRQNGFIFGNRPRLAGEPHVAMVDGKPVLQFAERSAAANDSFWDGLQSISERGVKSQSKLSKLPRSGRTLRTPTFELRHGIVHCRVRGSGHVVACVDSHRLIAGPLHGETVQKIGPGDQWVRLDLERYVQHRLHLEFTPDENAQLQISYVVQGASPEVLEALAQQEAAGEQWVRNRAKAVARALNEASVESTRLNRLIQSWADQRAALQSRVQRASHLAMAMMDGTGEDDHVLIRGSSSNPGEIVPRRFLTALGGDEPQGIGSGSGRLELAQNINDPTNPLPARVIVNRVWHWLMGRGLVPTTDDFGVLGQRPTHPELLDHLATSFLADGQSIKRMIRTIVLSRTYQMSSHATPRSLAEDPKNLLWHHRPPKRLEGEAIRDALLAVSGQLEPAMFGEPVPIHLTTFMDGRGRPANSGPIDGDRRRSIYVAVRRNFLSPFMQAFDMPVPFSTMGRRNVSNVPSQALILMNDPFVVDQASKWAQRALRLVPADGGTTSVTARIDWMYVTAFGRHASKREQEAATHFLAHQARSRDVALHDVALWSDLAHALVNTKEFIFLR